MMLRVVLLTLFACPALIQAEWNVPVVCPCTFVANRAVKLVRHVLKNDDKCGCSLPPLQSKETYEDYIKRVFLQQEKEPVEDYYTRIYKQYKEESDEEYIKRIDNTYSVFPTLPCKDNTEYWNFSERYYTLKYGRLDSIIPLLKESNDQYFARILRREKNEDFGSFIKRLDCVFKAYPKLDIWRRIKFDSDCKNWYFYRHVAYNCAIRPSENIRESIVTKYDRRECEQDDDISYFKRITERLSGECDEDYEDRITRIKSRFGNLSLWYSPEYVNFTKNYYKLLYAKKDNEDWNDYYKRLTTKSTAEDFPTYVKRIDILNKVLDNLPIWYNCDYLQFTAPYYNWIFAKKPDEDNVSYLKRITTRNPGEALDKYTQRLHICRWVNRGTDLFYNRKYWPQIKVYYENFYKKGKETTEEWLKKIFKRDCEESDKDYTSRLSLATSLIDTIGKIDVPKACLKYVSDFYRLVFKKQPDEDESTWKTRLTTRLPIETDITFQTRLKYLENIYTDCRSLVGGILKRLFGSDKTCAADKEVEVLLVKKKEKEIKQKEVTKEKQSKDKKQCNKKSDKKSIEEKIEELYGKKDNEDETAWFKRLTKKSSDESTEEYVKTVSLIRQYFPSLNVWYDKKYSEFVKDYYTCLYKKLENENDEQYFKRIVAKEPWESWEQTSKRICLVEGFYPNLPLWTNEKYYDSFVKNVYEVLYKKKGDESDEEYVKRILAKNPSVDTTSNLWAQRIHLIHRATASSPVWYEEKCFPFTKTFFQVWYKKGEKEDCQSWLTRVVKPLAGESEDNAIKRVHFVKETTGDCGCWTEFTFKKVASSKCLSNEYLNDIENQFFDSATTYERIYSSSKSSAKSEAASSEKSVEVVKKA